MSLSERGWIATAKDSDSGRYMMVKQVGSPTKINASTFLGYMSPTIFSSPKSFAVFSLLRPPFFRQAVGCSMIFHDLSAFSQHFPAVFRGSPAPSLFSKLRRRDDERHNVGRGKGLGKDAGAAARQAGEVRRLIRLAAQVGAPWGWPGWRGIFIQFYLFSLGILEFRG